MLVFYIDLWSIAYNSLILIKYAYKHRRSWFIYSWLSPNFYSNSRVVLFIISWFLIFISYITDDVDLRKRPRYSTKLFVLFRFYCVHVSWMPFTVYSYLLHVEDLLSIQTATIQCFTSSWSVICLIISLFFRSRKMRFHFGLKFTNDIWCMSHNNDNNAI